MRTGATLIPIMLLLALIVPSLARAHSAYSIGQVSQQTSPSSATAGASVEVSSRRPGVPTGAANAAAPVPESPSAGESLPAATPVSSGESSGSGGYIRLRGNACPALNYPPPCVLPVSASTPAPGAARPARPAVSPVVVAERVAARLSLAAGQIQASPRTEGLTGAASWFWLSPTTSTRSLSVALGGERVTVTATPQSVRWSFGDGTNLTGGPGVAYRPGTAPAGAVRHIYQTRCLPGDQGHDPNVLASCGPDGYTAEALVQWTISYTATGPVAGGGALPSRPTATSTAYPVREARAFLTAGGGQ
jgi:hypothetical protein